MSSLNKYVPSLKTCDLCHTRFWYSRIIQLDMKTADGLVQKNICKHCDQTLEYWRKITELRAKKED